MIYDFKIDSTKYYFDGNSLQLFSDFIPDVAFDVKKQDRVLDVLNKVVFNISNLCHGQCVYCYQDGGHFGQPTAIMETDAAEKALSYIIDNYNSVKTVSFFGGEPTLNFSQIKFIVDQLERFSKVEAYDITTNASNIDDEMIAFFIEHDFKVIISIDGPEHIHNKLRLNCSYEKVLDVINKIKESPIRSKLELNCTYTKYHIENIERKELIDFFENLEVKYCITNVITDSLWLKLPESNTKEHIDRSYELLISNSLNKGISGYVTSVIHALVQQKYQERFCYDLCSGYLAVFDCKGDRYPCVSLLYECDTEDPEIEKCNSKDNPVCNSCWAKGLCFDCIANVIKKKSLPPYANGDCHKKEFYAYALEKLIGYYHKDTQVFQQIIDNYC